MSNTNSTTALAKLHERLRLSEAAVPENLSASITAAAFMLAIVDTYGEDAMDNIISKASEYSAVLVLTKE